jgi:hypothetical protein
LQDAGNDSFIMRAAVPRDPWQAFMDRGAMLNISSILLEPRGVETAMEQSSRASDPAEQETDSDKCEDVTKT